MLSTEHLAFFFQKVPLNKLIEHIDETRIGNLSSAIRVFVLEHLEHQLEQK